MILVDNYIRDYVPPWLISRFIYWLKRWDSTITRDMYYQRGVLDIALEYAQKDFTNKTSRKP